MSKVPKKLQPFNEPGRNQTYNVNGVDYKNENAVSGRGRKRRIGKSDNEEDNEDGMMSNHLLDEMPQETGNL